MDILLLLPLLAVEIDGEWIIALIAGVLGGGTGGGASLWKYWQMRAKEKTEVWKTIVADKDALIGQKDDRIEKLSKELSKKSDAHAEKIQELMTMMLDKVEEWSSKLEGVLSGSLTVQSEFSAEVRAFTEQLKKLVDLLNKGGQARGVSRGGTDI